MWWLPLLVLLFPGARVGGAESLLDKPFHEWSLQEALYLLNDSPWAKQMTFTRVVGGVGSGVSGEKEIYNTYYARLLSARPVREALARIQQIHHGYDDLSSSEQERFDELIAPGLDLDLRRWIVVAVVFRSNNPGEEIRVNRFFRTQSAESLKNAAFLSTSRFSQIPLAAYYPPRGDGVGAKFVFPRQIQGEPVARATDGSITFELDLSGADARLSVPFSIPQMIVDGGLVL